MSVESSCRVVAKLEGVGGGTEGACSSSYGVHYWKIEVADGPTSIGVCCRCGKSRVFFNSVDFPWRAGLAKNPWFW